MTPKQAAKIIGCSPQQVRTLIRKGTLWAKKVPTDQNQHGYTYNVDCQSVRAYAKRPQSQGWPRGQSWEFDKE